MSHDQLWVQHLLYDLRDVRAQSNRLIFRQNLQKLGWVLGLAVASKLPYRLDKAKTPLGEKECMRIEKQPVLAMILRAGMPLTNGLMDIFPEADVSFIGAMRVGEESSDQKIELTYLASGSLEDRPLVIVDPMLATGRTVERALKALAVYGKASHVYVVSALASKSAVTFIMENYSYVQLVLGDIDPELNDKNYIIPGLGDAGDLSFGTK